MLQALFRVSGTQAATASAAPNASTSPVAEQAARVEAAASASLTPTSDISRLFPAPEGVKQISSTPTIPAAAPASSLTASLADKVKEQTPAAPLEKEAGKVEGEAPIAALEAADVAAVASASIVPPPPASSWLYTAAVFPIKIAAWPVQTLASGLSGAAGYVMGRK
jgi:hypothetical protein